MSSTPLNFNLITSEAEAAKIEITWKERESTPGPRYKDWLRAIWCLSTDWLGAVGTLYRDDKRGPLIWLGEKAQIGWHITHNCRPYRWLDQ